MDGVIHISKEEMDKVADIAMTEGFDAAVVAARTILNDKVVREILITAFGKDGGVIER